jgi:SAM-dependent methyltransferase
MTDLLYDSFFADLYDEAPLVRNRLSDVAFYREEARVSGEPLLELGCGTGRITLAAAEEGQKVTGLDRSNQMLARAVKHRASFPAEVQERVRFVHGDMSKFDIGEKFGLVIIPFRPFQHLLEVQQQLACLRCSRNHLLPEGRLILDVFHPDPERLHDPRFLVETPLVEYAAQDGRAVQISERVRAYHQSRQQNEVEMIFLVNHPGGRSERLVFSWTLRYFFRYEVEHLLVRAGFTVESVYGNFDRSPLEDSSPEMIFIAKRA